MSDDDMFLSSPTPSPGSVGCLPSQSPSPYTPSAPTDYESQNINAEGNAMQTQEVVDTQTNAQNKVFRVRVEFLDDAGNNVAQTRYSEDREIVDILGSLIRSSEQHFKKFAVKKMCNSDLLQKDIQKTILHKLSADFSKFLSSDGCPLKDDKLFNSLTDFSKLDLNSVLLNCHSFSRELVNAFSILCFGKESFEEIVTLPDSKHIKQRLLAIMSISAISRSQRVNLYQRIIGEYLKLKNTSKQGLQLIHRLGLSMIPVTIRSDQDRIAEHFLKEVQCRKQEIELWARRREMLEQQMQVKQENIQCSTELNVRFTPDEFIPKMNDIGVIINTSLDGPEMVQSEPDNYVVSIMEEFGSVQGALDFHLDSRPPLIDVTFDNVDIGRVPNEFIVNENKDQSLHWTSSILVEDIVHGREIQETKVDRSLLVKLEEKLHVTKDEDEHLCNDYTLLVMNIIADNWPDLLPDIKKEHIPHQYSKEFEQAVPIWTGPLIFESENNLDGMKKVITNLIDVVCPVVENKQGKKVPIYPTTFSGDNKSEQCARSAQLALADDGNMRNQLAFIQGRHEMLHFCFMFIEVIFDVLADKNNLEEGASLSRLVQWLNPKLVNKHAKDDYYKFRDMLTDIYTALLGENLRHFFNVDDLEKDVTPDYVKHEINPRKKQTLIFELIRSFVIKTHEDFKNCKTSYEDVTPLPKFYPHQNYVRKSVKTVSNSTCVENKKANVKNDREKEVKELIKTKTKPDHKNNYAGAMLSLLGQFQLLIDSIKEGNGLNVFLIQKKVHKLIYSTGHKNYSCSLSSFKHIVMSHPIPQYSHRYLWNQFCGRAGKGNKMARDQREEHLNRFLKDGFRTLGVNLNAKNATRINNSADLGQTLVKKVIDFHNLDVPGQSHTRKDRKPIRKKISEIFRKEEVVKVLPGRKFRGPNPSKSASMGFDEVKYRVWHQSKEAELVKFSQFRELYQMD